MYNAVSLGIYIEETNKAHRRQPQKMLYFSGNERTERTTKRQAFRDFEYSGWRSGRGQHCRKFDELGRGWCRHAVWTNIVSPAPASMAKIEAFLLPFHWEDVVIDQELVRKHPTNHQVAARYTVSVDAFDLADSISVRSAVALACGDVIENVPDSILPTVTSEASENEASFTVGAETEGTMSCWWQAFDNDQAAIQFRALLWCIHHWRGLNDSSMRLQLFRSVQRGLLQALAAMRQAAEAGSERRDDARLPPVDSWRSTIRLVAFVAAHWLQAAEQDLSDEAAEAGIPLSNAWWHARQAAGPHREPSHARGKQRGQLGTPSISRGVKKSHRVKGARAVRDLHPSDEELSDEEQAPASDSNRNDPLGTSPSSDAWISVYEAEREELLAAFGQLLRDKCLLQLAFSGASPEDAYLYLFVRAACALLESRSLCRQERARGLLVELVTDCLSQYGQGNRLCPILVHALERHEHVATLLVDMILVLGHQTQEHMPAADDLTEKDPNHPSGPSRTILPLSASSSGRAGCIRDLVTQVVQIPLSELARDHACARNVARFLTEFADRAPSLLIPYLPLWIPHLDGEAYVLRNALVHAFGQVIQYIAETHSTPEPDSMPSSDETRALFERLLHLLLKRLEDVHSLARSRAVQVWQRLGQARCIPVNLYPTLGSNILLRLRDKSVHVRRAALQLFTTCIRLNPFAAHLEEGLFALRQEQCLRTQQEESSKSDSLPPEMAQEGASFYGLAAAFAQTVQEAVPVVCSLCRSQQSSDVVDAISALCAAYQFRVPTALTEAPRQMLRLGMSRETGIRDAALSAFHTMYFVLPLEQILRSAKHTTDAATAAQALQTLGVLTITQALVALVARATVGDLVCLETVLPALVRSERVAPSVLQCWWDVLDERIPGSNQELARGCLFLIQCVAPVVPLTTRQRDLLHERAFDDFIKARWACAVLRRGLAAQTLAPDDVLIVERLEALLTSEVTSAYWPVAAQAAVATIFHCSRDPHQSIRRALGKLINKHRQASAPAEMLSESATHASEQTLPLPWRCSSRWLARLFTVISAFALHELRFATNQVRLCLRGGPTGYTDETGLAEAISSLQLQEQPPALGRKGRRQPHAAGASAGERGRSVLPSMAHTPADPIDVLVSTTEPERFQYLESRFDQVCSALEADLAASDAPLCALAPLAAHVLLQDCSATTIEPCRLSPCSILPSQSPSSSKTDMMLTVPMTVHERKTDSPPNTVGAAAALALGRLACLHESVAERYLRVLFTGLQQARSAHVRLNIVVALGDLVSRFPNRLEPWTDQLYAVLHRDQDARVRRYMLMVLTHLILNEMVKIKGHWADLVLCLKDPDAAVARLARTLFTEMQRKRVSAAQTLVLLLPDLVCSLSSPSVPHRRPLSDESFRDMMQFLLSFVHHERLTENLLERFCYRLRGAPDIGTARRLALCIPLLRCTSERCLKRLHELVKCYANRLDDAVIADCFRQVLVRARRATRGHQEVRALIDDLEHRLVPCAAAVATPCLSPDAEALPSSPGAMVAFDLASTPTTKAPVTDTPVSRVRCPVSMLRTPASARQSARARARTVMRQLVEQQHELHGNETRRPRRGRKSVDSSEHSPAAAKPSRIPKPLLETGMNPSRPRRQRSRATTATDAF
jgi:hypothetical protein